MKLNLGSIMAAASGGLPALAPMFAASMPNAIRLLVMQRHFALMVQHLAMINRSCGDALAIAIGNQQDVNPANMLAIEAALNQLVAMLDRMPHGPDAPAGIDALTAAYNGQ